MPEVILPNPLGETDMLRSYERGRKVASMVGVEESMVIDREKIGFRGVRPRNLPVFLMSSGERNRFSEIQIILVEYPVTEIVPPGWGEFLEYICEGVMPFLKFSSDILIFSHRNLR